MTARRRALALLALMACIVLTAVGCGGDDGGGDDSADARALLERAFKSQVDSADLRVDLEADLEGIALLKGPVSLTLRGPFESNGKGKVPSLDWDVTFKGANQNLAAGLVVTSDNAYVNFLGQDYEVGEQAFAKLSDSLGPAGASANLGSLGLDPGDWVEDPKIEDGDDIGGDPTRVIKGSVDTRAAVDDVLDALRSPKRERQLGGSAKLPEVSDETLDKIAAAVKKLDFEVNVDENDVIRRVFADAEFELPEGTRPAGLSGGKLSVEIVLEKVDIDPDIRAPANPQPLSALLGRLGLGSLAPSQQ